MKIKMKINLLIIILILLTGCSTEFNISDEALNYISTKYNDTFTEEFKNNSVINYGSTNFPNQPITVKYSQDKDNNYVFTDNYQSITEYMNKFNTEFSNALALEFKNCEILIINDAFEVFNSSNESFDEWKQHDLPQTSVVLKYNGFSIDQSKIYEKLRITLLNLNINSLPATYYFDPNVDFDTLDTANLKLYERNRDVLCINYDFENWPNHN